MLSICIVNWNNRDYLRECLASIRACPPDDETVEVIVVDNASYDGSAEMIKREFEEVRLIALSENCGYAAGNNTTLRAANGDTLLLLNPDVRLLPGAFDAALNVLRSSPQVGAASIRFLNPDGSVQSSVRGFPTPTALMWEVTGLSRLFPKNRSLGSYFMRWFRYDRVMEVDQPMGTFLMICREALEDVGLLDEQFPIFFNEVDWCYRAVHLGWKIMFTPYGEIVHYGGRGTKLAPKTSMMRESHGSLLRYYAKHYRRAINSIYYALIVLLVRAAEGVRLLRARR